MASDHGPRIQYAAAADFYFVSEHGSEFLKTCLDPFVSGFYYDEFLSDLTLDVMDPAPIWDL